jgi:uncharacterized protein (TIGR03382 family)
MTTRLALLAGLTLAVPCAAYELRKDSQGEGVRWAGRVEFVVDAQLAIQLGARAADAAVEAAVTTLGAATPGLEVSVRAGTTQGLGYRPGATDNQNEISALEDWPYDARALAATVVTINLRTHEIVDADIVFNAAAHHFRVVDALEAADLRRTDLDDVQNTLTHELGHALGLMHNPDDAKVVMYPSAAPLEISKRVLASDDRDGLLALYAAPDAGVPVTGLPLVPAAAGVTGGCASTGDAGTSLGLLVATLATLWSRRRRAGLVLALAPSLALAAPDEPRRLMSDLAAATGVSVARVRSATTVRLPGAPGLLFTDLELERVTCLQGACAAALVLRVPGGREGDLEQVVAHQPVPALEERVLLVAGADRSWLLRAGDRAERDQLAAALGRAGLSWPVSLGPQASPSPPRSGAQVPGTLR